MSKAYKCDVSGKLHEGHGLTCIRSDVHETPDGALYLVSARVQRVISADPLKVADGVMSPEAADRIKAALDGSAE